MTTERIEINPAVMMGKPVVYARGRSSAGVIFVKFHGRARENKPAAVLDAVSKLGERLREGFAVIEPGRVRLAKRP